MVKLIGWIERQRAFGDILYFAEHILGIRSIWPEWRKVLREFYALKDDGTPKYREMVACVGMRSGKTFIAAIICLYEFYKLINMPNPQEYWELDQATSIYIVNCARSEAQAKFTVFAFMKNFIKNSPYFKSMLSDKTLIQRHNEFEYPDKKIFLRSEHSASGSLAGKTSKIVVLDELDKFEFVKGGETSADEVYGIVSKSTSSFDEDGKVLSISSPISADGLFWKLKEKGEKDPSLGIYVIHKPTWEMADLTLKPHLAENSPYMIAQREKDYDKCMRDFAAQPVGRLVPFFPDTLPIKRCERGVANPIKLTNDGYILDNEFVPQKYMYVIAGDPALRRDAFGLVMGHVEKTMGKEIIVADFTMKFERILPAKEIDAKMVRGFIMTQILDRGFNVKKFVTDIKTYPELFQDIEKRGVEVIQSMVKKETYDYLKERINLGEITWPKNNDLFDELSHLEIISQRKVDHPKYGSKDISDSLANMAFFIKSVQKQMPAWAYIDW